MILKKPITGPEAWRGIDLRDNNAWFHTLSSNEITAIDSALNRIKDAHRAFPKFVAREFQLPALADTLQTITNALENGHGFYLLRGLPVERYSDEDINNIYYGIGLNLGTPVTQNPNGDLLGTVANVGDLKNKHTRVYETNAYLPYHTDPSDVVGLLCLKKAKSGGLSSLVSAATIYNRLLEQYPEYLGIYYRPMFYAHLGEDTRSPIFSFHEGKLSCRYLRQYIELGHDINNTSLSSIEIAALDQFDAIMQEPDIRLDMMLEPGDIQFANNYAILHSRTQFVDDNEPSLRRKMLRLWLKMPNARRLAPDFPGRNGFGALGD